MKAIYWLMADLFLASWNRIEPMSRNLLFKALFTPPLEGSTLQLVSPSDSTQLSSQREGA